MIKHPWLHKIAFTVAIFTSGLVHSQITASATPAVVICDESSGCNHQFVDGEKYKILTTDGISITVSLSGGHKFARAHVLVQNKLSTPIDVLPETFILSEVLPKDRTFAYISPEKIVKADAHRAGWANAINSIGAGMATQQVTTQTSSNGSVYATGSDGSSANGTYSGSSTSTTSVPNYAAQAQARENIRRRREAVAEESIRLSQTSLKANSVLPSATVGGFVYFDFAKKVESVQLALPVNGVIYKFPFSFPRK